MLRPLLAGSVVAAALLAVVPAAAVAPEKKAPPRTQAFPADDYLEGVLKGRLYVGGDPPKLLGAKTQDKAFLKDDRYHYLPAVGLRRAGRDDGTGRFPILRSRNTLDALVYLLKINPELMRFVGKIFHPSSPLKQPVRFDAVITYTFEIAPDSPSPQFEEVNVSSVKHPTEKHAALVTLKKGLTPGTYILRVKSEIEPDPKHWISRLYALYEKVTGVTAYLKLLADPRNVEALGEAVEQAADDFVEKIMEHPELANALGKKFYGSKLGNKIQTEALKEAVKTQFTSTEAVYKLNVPAQVPNLVGKSVDDVITALHRAQLRWRFKNEATTDRSKLSPGDRPKAKSQWPPPRTKGQATKVKVGSYVDVRFWVLKRTAPPPRPTPTPGTTTATTAPPNQIVSFPTPQVIDRIKIGNSPYEPFRVWACDPAKAGSCTKSDPYSDIRAQARVFCQANGTAGQPGSRVGSDQSYYPQEAPDPGDYAWVDPPTRWVVASNGFVSFTARAAVFSVIRCLRR